MSLKFLVIGDLHWRSTNPYARLDNFKDALTAKLQECWEIAEQHQVSAILMPGDLFNSPGIVYTTLADLMFLFQQAPSPVYVIPGNHDLFASSPESLYRTPLGFLLYLGVVKDPGNGLLLSTPNGDTQVHLSGRGYDAGTDIDLQPYGLEEPVDNAISIRLTHGMLVENPVPTRHTLMRDLLELEYAPNIIVNGHFHLGSGITRVGPTLVVNPGALCRNTADLSEMTRPVQVALVSVVGQEYDAELITLQSAKPGSEVLSREHLERQAQAEQRKREFLNLLVSEEALQALDLAEMVKSIGGREKIPLEVQEEALRRIAKAQEAMMVA